MFHASCPGLCQPRFSGQRPCDQEFELPVSSHNRWRWHALQRHRYRRTCHGWWSRDTGGIWRWSTLQSATRASAALKMPKCSFVRTPLDGRKKSFSLREFHGCRNRSGRSGPVSICALDRNGQSGPGRCPGRSPDATGSGLSGPVLILQKHYPCPVRPGAIFQNRCFVQSGPERCPAVYWFSPIRCPVRPVDDSAYHRIRCTVRFSVDLAILQRCPNSLCPNWY